VSNVIGGMLFRPQPIVIAMEHHKLIEGLDKIEIEGKEYPLLYTGIYFRTIPRLIVKYPYNCGMYILRNPYPKELSVDEAKPEINYIKISTYQKIIDYYLLLNVRRIKLKVYAHVTHPQPSPQISLYVADEVIDITKLETWQDINVEFPKRIPMSIMYIDVKDKKNEPDTYSIHGNIKDWEFIS